MFSILIGHTIPTFKTMRDRLFGPPPAHPALILYLNHTTQ